MSIFNSTTFFSETYRYWWKSELTPWICSAVQIPAVAESNSEAGNSWVSACALCTLHFALTLYSFFDKSCTLHFALHFIFAKSRTLDTFWKSTEWIKFSTKLLKNLVIMIIFKTIWQTWSIKSDIILYFLVWKPILSRFTVKFSIIKKLESTLDPKKYFKN